LIGYYASLVQLKQLNLIKEIKTDLKSEFYKQIFGMYEEMGDHISLQYGGSIAHHAQVGQKKGKLSSISELLTSFKRHLANNFTDPQKQNVFNLFLGIY
jgi:phosphatidylinositol 3,5-bisphosphate 5-phosphatase